MTQPSGRHTRRARPWPRWLQRLPVSAEVVGDADTVVTGISLSSQRVLPGDLYAALPGARAHGIDYAADAEAAGAVAVLTDPHGRDVLGDALPAVVVDAAARRSWAASRPRSTAARPSGSG